MEPLPAQVASNHLEGLWLSAVAVEDIRINN